jgi:hypothetical protein
MSRHDTLEEDDEEEGEDTAELFTRLSAFVDRDLSGGTRKAFRYNLVHLVCPHLKMLERSNLACLALPVTLHVTLHAGTKSLLTVGALESTQHLPWDAHLWISYRGRSKRPRRAEPVSKSGHPSGWGPRARRVDWIRRQG